jgi:hypothetical protein
MIDIADGLPSPQTYAGYRHNQAMILDKDNGT